MKVVSGYPLEVLGQLRRLAADDARQWLGAAVAKVKAEEQEYRRLSDEVESIRRQVVETEPGEDRDALQQAARFRARLGSLACNLREQRFIQSRRLTQCEAAARQASDAFARARAEYEALKAHRQVWIDEKRAAVETAEERETEDWLGSRFLGLTALEHRTV